MFTAAELSRRMARVRVLLETHDEPYDELSRRETSHAGFGEPRFVRARCVCDGAGCGQCRRSAARAADQGSELLPSQVFLEERDPYDTGVDGSFDPNARTRRDEAARIEGILDRLREDELLRAGLIAHVQYEKVLKASEARDRRGAYRALRAALDAMPRHLGGECAVRWLAEHMPGPIHVPRWAFEQELEQLRDEAVAAKKEGLQVSEIAEALSISQRQVKRLLKEAKRS